MENELMNDEIKNNLKQIKDYDNKINILDANTLNSKIWGSIGSGIYVYFSVGLFNAFTHVISPEVAPSLIISTSFFGGALIRNLLSKKFHVKEKKEKISTSKTEEELLSEKIKYEIEKEKLISKNEIIDKSNLYYRCFKVNYNKIKEDLEQDELSKTLEEKQLELDKKIENKILYEKFSVSLDKNSRIMKLLFDTMMTFFLALMASFNVIVVQLLKGNLVGNFTIELIGIVLPAVVAAVTTILLEKKQVKIDTKAYENLKQEYKDSDIYTTNKYQIEKEIEKLKGEIVNLLLEKDIIEKTLNKVAQINKENLEKEKIKMTSENLEIDDVNNIDNKEKSFSRIRKI